MSHHDSNWTKKVPALTLLVRIQLLEREIAIQRYLDHPNICRPIGVIFDLFGSAQNPTPCIVHPLMARGNVLGYMAALGHCDQRHKQKTFYRIVSLLFHCRYIP